MSEGKLTEAPFRQFLQIPGPNPIVVSGGPGDWDEACIECCDVFKDYETYYLYYHGVAKDPQRWPRRGYQVGVATAPAPLGPWTKHKDGPLLALGQPGEWDDGSVACASVVKEGSDRYFLWYSGKAREKPGWSIGLATAPGPLGPWKKHPGNPVLQNFGYVGAVVRVNGKYHLYTEHPISSTGPDYGPFSHATADAPEGPWTAHEGNPVLMPDDWGSWDDGGFSEAEVHYRDGVFHVFYGAAKLHPVRIRTLESIGYAYSLEGQHFTKYPGNPVAMRERNPDASAFAEVHSLIEPPFVYCYHTLRYLSSEPGVEHLGVQILATSRPFRITMPVLCLDLLRAGTSSKLEDCPPISLDFISTLSLTVEGVYHAEAKQGLRVRVRPSYDGVHYDTTDFCAFDNDFVPGQVGRKTVAISPQARFVKVLVENLDKWQDVAQVRITATLGSS
jgi:hypothetical protein